MSMREAIEDVIKDMEEYAIDVSDPKIMSFVRQLRLVLKATEADAKEIYASARGVFLNPLAEEKKMAMQQSQQAMQEDMRRQTAQEMSGTRMVELEDVSDPAGPCYIEIPAQMPEGAFTKIGSITYQLKDNKLVRDSLTK